MHLGTLEQIVTIILGAITLSGLGWRYLVLPWLKGMANEIVPGKHDLEAPTLRQMQVEELEIVRRMEASHKEEIKLLRERQDRSEQRQDATDKRVDDHETRIGNIENRLDRAGIAK